MANNVLDKANRMKPDRPAVFISYARADAALVNRLVDDLRAAGHACWIDTSNIPGGEVWLEAIAAGIKYAYAFSCGR